MTYTEKTTERIHDFKNALLRLEEAHARDWFATGDTFVRDALIQRFEISFDTSWKSLQAILREVHTIDTASPLVAIQEAVKVELIQDPSGWLEMKTARNETSHIYKEEMAIAVSQKMHSFILILQDLASKI